MKYLKLRRIFFWEVFTFRKKVFSGAKSTKMNLKIGISQGSIPSIVSLIIVAGLFGFYFFIHLPDQKERLVESHFKELSKSAEYITDRYEDYTQSIRVQYNQNAYCDALSKSIEQNKNNVEFFDLFDAVAVTDTVDPLCFYSTLFKVSNVDSLLRVEGGIVSASLKQINIAEEPYMLFIQMEKVTQKNQKDVSAIYFCGLVSKERFDKEARRINSWILTNVIIILLILVMALPFLKFLVLSPIERLYRFNVFWLGVSLILGSGLIMLLFISFYLNLNNRESSNERLKDLADEVSKDFIAEIDDAYEFLSQYDKLTLKCKSCTKKDRDRFTIAGTNEEFDYSKLKDFNPKFISLYWIDTSGTIQTYISKDKNQIWGKDVSDRIYFQNIKNNEPWTLPGSPNKKFALQSIVSWRTGKSLAIVTKDTESKMTVEGGKVKNMEVIALSSFFSSVMDPLLPKDYGFAIVDEKGSVWFHSEKENSLNENFIDAVNGNSKIKNAIKDRTIYNGKVRYRTNHNHVYIEPIQSLPLSVVTFYNLENQKISVIQILSTTYVLFIIMLVVVLIQKIILLLIVHGRTKLKKKRFYFNWLLPDKMMRRRYSMLLISNVAILIYLAITTVFVFYVLENIHYKNQGDPVFSIIVTQIYLAAFIYYLINFSSKESQKMYHQSLDQLRENKSENEVEYMVSGYKRFLNLRNSEFFIGASGFLIVVLNWIYFLNFKSSGWFVILFQIGLVLTMLGIIKVAARLSTSREGFWGTRFERYSAFIFRPYVLFLFSWLIISTMFPIFYFYKFSVDADALIRNKNVYSELSEKYEQRSKDLRNYFDLTDSQLPSEYKNLLNQGFYHFGIYDLANATLASFSNTPKDQPKYLSAEESYSFIRHLSSGNKAFEQGYSSQFVKNQAFDQSWSFNRDSTEFLYFGSLLNLTWVNVGYQGTERRWGLRILFLVFFILSIGLIYKVLSFSINRIFARDYAPYIVGAQGNIDFLKDSKNNRRIFITRIAHASSQDAVKSYLKYLTNSKKEFVKINLRKLMNANYVRDKLQAVKSAEIVVFKNFEYLSNSHDFWQRKKDIFDQIESIDRKKEKQLLISSQQHPLIVTKFYEVMLDKSSDQKWNPDFRKDYEEYRQACSQWRKFFDTYVRLSEPIRKEKHLFHLQHDYDNLDIEIFLNEELGYGTYLRKLEPLIHQYYQKLKARFDEVDIDDLVLKIQSLAEPYYYSLWSSLSKEERFLVYDLAKDGFINVKNTRGIHILMEKGIFIYENNLKLLNKSFNNFILSVVDASTEWEMRREVSKQGSWGTTKGVLLIFVLGIIAFIAISTPDMIKNFNTVVGAIIALLTLMLRSGTLLFAAKPS